MTHYCDSYILPGRKLLPELFSVTVRAAGAAGFGVASVDAGGGGAVDADRGFSQVVR